jgi:hypothetical protein
LRLGKGRVPSRGYVGRGKVPVAGERDGGCMRFRRSRALRDHGLFSECAAGR